LFGRRAACAPRAVTRQWNPATGAIAEAPLGLPGLIVGQFALPAGILSLSTLGCEAGGESSGRLRLGLLTAQGKHLRTETDAKIGAMRWQFLQLADDAAVVVTHTQAEPHIAVFVIRRRGDTLVVDPMPHLPLPYRGDFAAAIGGGTTPAEGRLMILGGADGEYRGCGWCRAEAQVLDFKTRTWSRGPAMLEARAELGATRLPDGSVLVTGGWTRKAD
jgi:hypothetical protein